MQLEARPRDTPQGALTQRARLAQALPAAVGVVGPLFMFWLGHWLGGALWGIFGVVVWSAGYALYRVARGQSSSRLFWLTTSLMLVFGVFDLALGKSLLFRFEAALSNLLLASYFALSMLTGKSVLEELYEKSALAPSSAASELGAYLRLLTAVWAGYFALKAALYCWLALVLPLERLLITRAVVGNASLLALLGAERLLRVRLFRYLKAHGHLSRNAALRT